jgi:hypothetical protein
MNRKYKKIESEVKNLLENKILNSEEVINLFMKYEKDNISRIEKLTRSKKIEYNRIKGGLKQTIKAHGAIDSKLIGSATKRIYGALLSNEKPNIKFDINSFIWGVILTAFIISLIL